MPVISFLCVLLVLGLYKGQCTAVVSGLLNSSLSLSLSLSMSVCISFSLSLSLSLSLALALSRNRSYGLYAHVLTVSYGLGIRLQSSGLRGLP